MKKKITNVLHMLSIPLGVYVLMFVICRLSGAEGFGVGSDLVVMLRNAMTTGCIALAFSYNLTSGRFDFSVGATLVLACIFGGRLVSALGIHSLGGALVLLVSVALFGALLGAFNGGIYVLLRLPPMICSLGVCMLFEAIGYVFTGGSGVSFLGRNDLLIWASSPTIYVLMVAILLVLYVLLNKTRFGYDSRSLRTGQEIAVNSGINEKRNAVFCYLIAGALLGVAGVLNMSVYGKMDPEVGLTSISYIQNAFLPMFIGNYLEKYGDRNVGVIMGAIAQAEITAAFGRMGVSSSMQNVLSGVIVIGFFAYSGNVYRLVEMRMFREKKLRALEMRKVEKI